MIDRLRRWRDEYTAHLASVSPGWARTYRLLLSRVGLLVLLALIVAGGMLR